MSKSNQVQLIKFSSPGGLSELMNRLDRLLLDDKGRIRLLPASAYDNVDRTELRAWCHQRARYSIPTQELVEWIKDKIGGRAAIEIGAGNGDMGYHLGIPMTDAYLQQNNACTALTYLLTGQPATNPNPEWVENRDALSALAAHHPKVVVASWLTRKFEDGKDEKGVAQASIYGPREEDILDFPGVETYIHVGNSVIHGEKTLLQRPHTAHKFNWIVSRASVHSENVIYVWNRT